MQLQFFLLGKGQLGRFGQMKTDRELASHGPLACGQEVPVHDHSEPALYVVDGLAEFQGDGVQRSLGDGEAVNAVLVPANTKHGWRGLRDQTRIEHVFGEDAVNMIVAAA